MYYGMRRVRIIFYCNERAWFMRPAASPLLINDAASSPPPALEQRPRAEEEPEEGRAPEGRPPHVADLVREPGDLIDRGAREETDETRRRSATEEEEEEEEEERGERRRRVERERRRSDLA